MITVISIISVALAVVFLMITCLGVSGFGVWYMLVDLPSFIMLAIFVIPIVCISGFGKDFMKAFQISDKKKETTLVQLNRSIEAVNLVIRTLLYGGVFTTLFSFIMMFQAMAQPEYVLEAKTLFINFGVAMLTMLYALAFCLLLLPVSAALKRKKIDYVQE